MKFCPKCGTQLEDNVTLCSNCGNQFDASVVVSNDPFDHTAEFDAKDISDNKVFAMCIYLMGWIGILVALLASKDSEYVKFHIRQALKIEVTNILIFVLAIIPFLGWFAMGVCAIILFVLRIIAFFQICGGKAKDAPLLNKLKFLN